MEKSIDIRLTSMPGLNVTELSSGVYHLKLSYKDSVISQKLIKQ
jgi:hypothetical protein